MYCRGIEPPKISSTNSKSAPRGSGSIVILQSANWPWPPDCFLCRPCASADLVIVSRYGTFGGWRITSTPYFFFSFVHDDLDVQLSLAADEELLRLLVALEADRRILFDDAVDRRRELVLVAARLRLDRERDRRLRILDVRDDDRVVLRRQRVAGLHVLQFRDRADVAGAQLGHRHLLLALQQLQLADALFVVPATCSSRSCRT